MAEINDPTINQYMSDFVRPISGSFIGDWAAATIELQKWFDVISPKLSAYSDTDVITDIVGPTQLTKADLINFMSQVSNFLGWANGSGVMSVISKPKISISLP